MGSGFSILSFRGIEQASWLVEEDRLCGIEYVGMTMRRGSKQGEGGIS